MKPRYKIGDTIALLGGWIVDVYRNVDDAKTDFVYAIQNAETEAIYFYPELDVDQAVFDERKEAQS